MEDPPIGLRKLCSNISILFYFWILSFPVNNSPLNLFPCYYTNNVRENMTVALTRFRGSPGKWRHLGNLESIE